MAVLLSGLRDKAPFIMVNSLSALLIVNVFSLIVGLLIGSLNVALISELTGTCVAPSAGIVLSTFGGSFSTAGAAAPAFVTVATVAAAAAAFSVADSDALVPKSNAIIVASAVPSIVPRLFSTS